MDLTMRRFFLTASIHALPSLHRIPPFLGRENGVGRSWFCQTIECGVAVTNNLPCILEISGVVEMRYRAVNQAACT